MITRRRVLKRIGAGATLAWSAPAISSLSRAVAQQPTPRCTECSAICNGEGELACGTGANGRTCGCRPIKGSGDCFCHEDPPECDQAHVLSCAEGPCPDGMVCIESDCCPDVGGFACVTPCGTPLPSPNG